MNLKETVQPLWSAARSRRFVCLGDSSSPEVSFNSVTPSVLIRVHPWLKMLRPPSPAVSRLNKRIRFFAAILLAVVLVPATVPARDMNPSTGRFMTMDTYEGSKEEPQSLHKYSYAHADPVNNTDPSGNAVYVVTRPLEIAVLNKLPSLSVHVYLAFDAEGITDLTAWNRAVSDSASTLNHPNTYGISYRYNDSPVTMSFHPRSVLNNDYTGAYFGVAVTPSSYLAYNAQIDIDAFTKVGTGYKRYAVASGDALQMQIFHFAIVSRNANNNGRPEPDKYSFLINNCGSWADSVLEQNGVEFPDRTINKGMGLDGKTSSLGYAVHAATRAVGRAYTGIQTGIQNFLSDFFF